MDTANQHPALRKRIIIIFIGAVLVPGLILCYLGLKTIKQEKSRQDQIHRQNLESIISLTHSRIESSFENSILDIFRTIPSFDALPDSSFIHHVQEVISQSILVEYFFIMNEEFQILYPRKFVAGDILPPIQRVDHLKLYSGELLEVQGYLQEALTEYREGLRTSAIQIERLTFLMRIARSEIKLNRFTDATQTYFQIIELDDHRSPFLEIPFTLIAYDQIVEINSRMDLPTSTLPMMLDYYKFLIENFDRFTEIQYNFYLNRIKDKLEQQLKIDDPIQIGRFKDLKLYEEWIGNEHDYHSFITANLLSQHRDIFSSAKESNEIKFFRSSFEDKSFVIALKYTGIENQYNGISGLVLNEENLIQVVVSAVERYNNQKSIYIEWMPYDAGFEELIDVNQSLVSEFSSLHDLFSIYKTRFTLSDIGRTDLLFTRSIILYYILFATIIGLILFGIIFIFRDISREEELSRLKSEFISNVTHEIKTPIATIRTLAENLDEGWISDPVKQQTYFRHINREAERLSHLTDNILDFSRLEAKRKTYPKELVNINELLQKIVTRFQLIYNSDHIKLITRIPKNLPEMRISPEAMELAILNVLDNAVKYSGKQNDIELRVKIKQDSLAVYITDSGIGIPKREQEMIFEKFYRVHNKNGNKVPGSGIGLSLVKEIVERHNGRIEIRSTVGRGSTFKLEIPINSKIENEKDTSD